MKNSTPFLNDLISSAKSLGATDAKVVSPATISVKDEIIELCKEPLCESYGKSINCPPHTMKPRMFRSRLYNYKNAILFKIDVPTEILLSERRFKKFRKIYHIAVQLEAIAIEAGFKQSRAFAAGSCKPVFCPEYQCQALLAESSCRYPDSARPSMEAVGIDVFKLIGDVGWQISRINVNSNPESTPYGLLTGLVLVG
jgi:predicted metal-binding protein